MKIRRLEIQGFKSFADRTSFEFDAGISAVVGPNGCGKSNIVDALKWVLGDMSPKSLRGKKMEDVIFAGSRHRKALPFAEVTLVLDNEEGRLRTERTEVSVTRRLDRDGNSEYRVNGQPARLKDIRELFMDTGLGTDGNAIMEQGQIDALLAANPQDRRSIFEEAAGVSRYKARRKESEQRLGRTDENLERLLDVIELEEKRLRSLKNQAGRARRYQEIRDELARKRVLRAVLRYRSIRGERETVQASLATALEQEQRVADELAQLEAETRAVEARRLTARDRVHEIETRITQAAADVRAAEDRATWGRRTKEELAARIETALGDAEASRARAASIRTEIAGQQEEIQRAEEDAASHASRLAEAEQELRRLEADAARIRDAHDGAKREALAALGRISQVRNEETERRTESRQAEERLGRLARQRQELEVARERIEGEARELALLQARLQQEGRERADALGAAEDRRARAVEAADAAQTRRAEASEARAIKAARLDVLDRLEAAQEGLDDGARFVLEAARESGQVTTVAGLPAEGGVLGILADLLHPEPEAAAALDRLLGPTAGALVVEDASTAIRWIGWLRDHHGEARARFLPLDMVREGAAALPAPLASGVPAPLGPLVASVAAGTALVDTLEGGVDAWRRTGTNAVTPRGDRVTASGALLGGADGRGLGLVGRGSEIRQLRAALDALGRRSEEARREAEAADQAVRDAEEAIRRLRLELSRHTEDRSRRGEALARAEKERSHVADGLALLATETQEWETVHAEALAAAEAVAARVAGLEEERTAIEERAEEASRGYLALEEARKAATERRMEVKLAVAEATGRSEGARQRIERAGEEIARLLEQAEALDQERRTLGDRLGKTDVEITEAEARAREGEGVRTKAGRELVEARSALDQLEETIGGEGARRVDVQRRHEDLRRRLEQFRVKDGELRVRVESLLEQVRQDHDLDLEEVAAEAEATESIDFEAIEAEVEQLRRRLENLGNVNMNAISELDEVQQHVDFLRAQEGDLLQAKSDLQKVIQELDEITTARFAETFEAVRTHFREVFRRLFGGGRAEIVLEDASNLLESGVDIVARPPGKEQRTISLLSGGERTLTAVALLFAVFKAKPSPFTILDEVDAALDEANVRRLIALVREFTDRTQFVIVTHAKTTMEAADVLYGVTMEEPGVSKKVGVRLTEYEALAAG